MTPQQEQKLDAVAADVALMKRVILGEEKTETPSLIHRVGKLEKWRSAIALKLAFILGAGAAVSFFGKGLWDLFLSLLERFKPA